MKNLTITFFLLLIKINLFSQSQVNNAIYFISGHPDTYVVEQFPVSLFKYKNSTFEKVSDMMSKGLTLLFVRPYYDEKIVCILGWDLNKNDHYYYLLKMDSPEKASIIKLENQSDFYLIESHLLKNDEGNLIQGFEFF